MVGIGRVVFRSREHMIALRPRGKGMVGTTLLYPYEVKKEAPLFVEVPDIKIDREMLGMAHQLIKSKQGHFEPQKFEDRYEAALRDLIAKKQKGATIHTAAPAKAATNVVNLMDALRKSLADGGGAAGAKKSATGKSKAKPDDLRRQPQFKFPIEGGKAKQGKEAKVVKEAAAPVARTKPKRKSA
jgi:DNA end-binding protein Ku